MIEELLYTGRNCAEVARFTGYEGEWDEPCTCDGDEEWFVSTPDGPVWARPDDVIIKHESDAYAGFIFTVRENS